MRRLYPAIITSVAVVVVGGTILIARSQSPITSAAVQGTATVVAPTVAGTSRSTAPLPTGPGAPTLVIPSGVPRPQTGPPPTRDPNGVPSVGLNGIAPRSPTTAASTPAFTVQDAIDYVASHPFVATKADSSGPVSVTSVQFLTTSQLQSQLGIVLNFAPDRLLCVVGITGNFTVYRPNGSLGNSTHAYEFFDAHTGNYLGVNVRPQ